MSGGQIMVVMIVAIVMIASILRHRMGGKTPRTTLRGMAAQDDPDRRQLLEEVRALKERVATLERITVDKENSLAREIEDLRTRP